MEQQQTQNIHNSRFVETLESITFTVMNNNYNPFDFGSSSLLLRGDAFFPLPELRFWNSRSTIQNRSQQVLQGDNSTMLSGSGDYNYGSPKSQMIWPQVIWPQVIGPQRSTENPDGIMNKLFGQDVQQQYRQQGAQLVANAAQQQVQQPDGGQQVVQPPAQSPVQAQQQQPGVLALDDSDNEIMKHLKHQLVVMKQDCDGRHQRINPVALTLAQVLSIITEKL